MLLVVAVAITAAVRSEDESRPRHRRGDPVVARLQIEARPELSFQAKEFTTVAGINEITLVDLGGTEGLVFDDPALSHFKLSVPAGPNFGTVDLHAGKDYRIHSPIPGHTEAGVEAVIHVLPAGAPGNLPLPSSVLDVVSKASQGDGGPAHGVAEYAVSTRNAANQALMSAEIPRDEQPVYVFVLRGSFVSDRGAFRDDGDLPSGKFLTLVVSHDSPPQPLDSGISPSSRSLSTLGGSMSTRY